MLKLVIQRVIELVIERTSECLRETKSEKERLCEQASG